MIAKLRALPPIGIADQFWLLLICGTLFFFRLGAARVWDVDEAIFSQTAWEMMDRGDYVVPQFNGRVLPDKPAFTYWAMIGAYKLLGPTEFAARFWSAVAGVGTVVLTYRMGSKLLNRSAGMWAGVVLGTSFNFSVIARAATPDSLLVFFSTLSLLILLEGTLPARLADPSCGIKLKNPRWPRWLTAYAAMSAAVLVKGPIGVLLPVTIYALYRMWFIGNSPDVPRVARGWARTWRQMQNMFAPRVIAGVCWQMRPLTAIAALLIISGPWYAMVCARTSGSWLWGFLGVHNVGRFLNPMDDHSGGALYYPVVMLFGLLPWSILAAPIAIHVVRSLKRRDATSPVQLFALVWVVVYVGFFSLARTKLPSYIVPAYPALALLAGGAIADWVAVPSGFSLFWRRICWGVLLTVGAGALVGFYVLNRLYLPSEQLLWLVALVPCCGAIAGLWLSARDRIRPAMQSLAVTAALMTVILFGFVVVRIDRYQASAQLDRVLRHRDSPALASFFYFRPSFVFYSKQPFTKLTSPDSVREFFKAHPGTAFVITTGEHMFRLAGGMPEGVSILEERPRFLQRGNIVVLGRREQTGNAQPRLASTSMGDRAHHH